MTLRTGAEWTLLSAGVGAELIGCLGILAMGSVFARLHYLSAATVVGPVAIAAAVVVGHGLSAFGVKALLIAAVFAFTGPVLTHAIARVAAVRRSLPVGEVVEREVRPK